MAMSEQTIGVVKASAFVVAPNAQKITGTFYRLLFSNNPEARAFFNETNQLRGRQSQALADAVVAYASNIDNLGALGELVEKIAHRHVALSVTADLYPIVHRNLMKAIAEVLGGDPEIGAAWSEAVLALAGVCIGAEEALYKQVEERAGGWRGQKEFQLVKREDVAQDTVAFSFAQSDFGRGYEFTPGQYLTIRIPGLDAAPRHYTVTSKPGDSVLQCTTRKLDGGQVSTYMHEKLKVGDTVLLAPPCGIFALKKSDAPKVLVSAGIGITPSWAFLQQGGAERIKAVLHVDRNEGHHAYRSDFESTGAPCTWLYTKEHGRPDLAVELARIVGLDGIGTEAEFYVCGPLDFMSDVTAVLTGLGVKHIFAEVFGTGSVPVCPVAGVSGRCPFSQ